MDLANICIVRLLQQHPWVAEVLEQYEIDLDGVDPTLSLQGLCRMRGVNPARILWDLDFVDGNHNVDPIELVQRHAPSSGTDEEGWFDDEVEGTGQADWASWWDDYVDYDLRRVCRSAGTLRASR